MNNTFRLSTLVSRFSRKYCQLATAKPLVNVEINQKTGVATVVLERPPVNCLNLELLSAISSSLADLEKHKCRGLILTSNSKSVFTAGLDILELYKPNQDRIRQFYITLQQTWMALYGSSYPTVALINGHAPAGGCLLALCCEYRVMLSNFTIGLNEVHLGLVVPHWLGVLMSNAMGSRQTELALTTGNLFKTEEALNLGLVDEMVQNKEEGLQKAEKFLEKFAKIPPLARALTKKSLREKMIQDLIQNQQKDLDYLINFLNQEEIQTRLGVYLKSLKKKQKS